MADPKVKLKRSSVAGRVPSPDQIPLGELALNTWDGQLYASRNVGVGTSVVAINPWIVGTGTDSYNIYYTAGNAGIGTTIPRSEFHVNGDIKIDRHLNVTGIVTASSFVGTLTGTATGLSGAPGIAVTNVTGFGFLRAPHSATTTVLTVTVASKDATHRYNGTGSGSGYLIDGVQSPFLTLTPGRTYRFDQSDSSNSSHPFRFYLEAGKTTQYSTNVTTNGTAGSAGAYTEIAVTDTTPTVLHYQCSAHANMGNSVFVSSNALISPHEATIKNYLTVDSGATLSGVTTLTTATAISVVVGSAVTLNSGGIVAGLGTFNSFNTTQLSVSGIATVTSGGVLGNIQVGKTGANEIDTSSGGLTIDSNGGVVTVDDYLGVNQGLSVTGISTLGHTIAGSAVTMTSGGIVAGLGTINYINATHVNAAGIVTAAQFVGDGSQLTGITGGVFVTNQTGIHTLTNIGIGTTSAFNALQVIGDANVSGVITANSFVGDGSGLTGVTGTGSGITIKDSGSTVGTAGTINFGTNLSVSPVSAGVVTITASGGGGSGVGYFVENQTGIHTIGNVGIGTTTANGAADSSNTSVLNAGIVTAVTYYGDGSKLTGVVAASSGIIVRDNGSLVGTAASLNFGSGFSLTPVSAGVATVSSTVGTAGIDRRITNFSATEGQTTFSVSYTVGNIDVFFNGVRLLDSDITASNGSSVVLSSSASAGDQIVVVEYLVATTGTGVSGQTVTTFTATAGQTTFGVSYRLGTVQVYRNGIRLVESNDYTANTGNTIVLVGAANVGDSVVVVETQGLLGFNQTGINTTSNLGIGTTSAYNALTVIGDANVSGVVTATGGFNIGIQSGGVNVLSGVVTALNFVGTGNTFLYNAGTKTVDITIQGGGGGTIGISSAGTRIGTGFTDLNIIGTGVSIVGSGTTVNIQVEPGLVGAAKSVTSFTATAGQTTFNVNYSQGQENVFLNGVRLSESQYTATNGSTVVLNTAASLEDSVDIVVYLRGADPNRNVEVTILPPFNGITTAFTMYKGTTDYLFDPIDERQIVVSLGGIIQQPGVAYTVGTGSSIFFSTAPGIANTCFITALYSNTVGVPTDAVKLNRQDYSPTGVQTSFTVTKGYRSGYLDVYVNGSRLVDGSDFTASNGTTFDLTTPAVAGDIVDVIAYQSLNLSYSEFAGLSTNVDGGYGSLTNLQVSGISTFTGDINADGDLEVDGHTELDNLQVSGISTFQNNVNIGTGATVVFFDVSTGNLGIGSTNATAKITSVTTSDDNLGLFRYLVGGNGPVIRMSHSYSNTIGGNDLIPGTGSGFSLGRIDFRGSLGSGNYGVGGRIRFLAKGSTSASSLPTDFQLSLSPAGSAYPSEVVRVGSAGSVGVGTDSPHSIVHVSAVDPAITLTSTDIAVQQSVIMNNSGNLYFRTHDQTGTFVSNDYLITKNNSGATTHQFRIANSEAARITSDGNIGIGTDTVGNISGRSQVVIGGDSGGLLDFNVGGTTEARLFAADATGLTIRASESDGGIVFQTAGSNERLRIDSTGKIILPTGSLGIQFGSSNTGTNITSQTLDDYEEGTWTPIFDTSISSGTLSGITYVLQSGRYRKIGNMVYIEGALKTSAVTIGANGTYDVSGLPFTVGNNDTAPVFVCSGQHSWTNAPHLFGPVSDTTHARARGGISVGDASYTNGYANDFDTASGDRNRVYFAGWYTTT